MKTLIFKGHRLNIKIETLYLNEEETRLIENALIILGESVNSGAFENFVLNYTWHKTYYKRKWFRKIWYTKNGDNFRWNNGLSSEEIFDKIMSGAETLDPSHDKEIDIHLKVDRRNKRGVVGYTYPNTKWQWIYKWVLRSYDEYDIAGNLLHEWCHKIGFDHEYRFSPLREFTVPYALGRFVSRYRHAEVNGTFTS